MWSRVQNPSAFTHERRYERVNPVLSLSERSALGTQAPEPSIKKTYPGESSRVEAEDRTASLNLPPHPADSRLPLETKLQLN